MKFKLLSTLFIWSGLSYGQLLYDPTVVYATAGSNDMFDIEQVLNGASFADFASFRNFKHAHPETFTLFRED